MPLSQPITAPFTSGDSRKSSRHERSIHTTNSASVTAGQIPTEPCSIATANAGGTIVSGMSRLRRARQPADPSSSRRATKVSRAMYAMIAPISQLIDRRAKSPPIEAKPIAYASARHAPITRQSHADRLCRAS